MDKALDLALRSVERMSDGFFLRLPNILISLAVLFVFVFLARFIKRLVISLSHRAHLDDTLSLAFGTMTTFTVNMLGLLIAATIVFPSFSPGNLVAGLGITSVAVGFAFKDILENFFAGILLLWQKPFRIGDQIRTQSYEGLVQDIDIRSTRIMTSDGELVVMPNGAMIASPIVVLTGFQHRRTKMTVPLGTAASVEDAREKILAVLRQLPLVAKDPAPVIYQTSLDSTNTNLDIYFWTGSSQEQMQQGVDQVAAALQRVLRATPVTQETGVETPASGQTAVVPEGTPSAVAGSAEIVNPSANVLQGSAGEAQASANVLNNSAKRVGEPAKVRPNQTTALMGPTLDSTELIKERKSPLSLERKMNASC